jgi:hypothetical protein
MTRLLSWLSKAREADAADPEEAGTTWVDGVFNFGPAEGAWFIEVRERWNAQVNPIRGGDSAYFPEGPALSSEHVANCRVLANRHELLHHLPANAVCAEVGTAHGEFAAAIRAVCKPAELHLFDLSFQRLRHVRREDVVLHEGDSADELAKVPDNYFDWIYIDGDHSYEGVRRDIAVAKHKLQPDGILALNDYTNWSIWELLPYGVLRAVNELCVQERWEMLFYCMDTNNYCDVAVRRIR